MKFTFAATYLIVLAAAFALLSTEAASARSRHSLTHGDLETKIVQVDGAPTSRRRRRFLEENEAEAEAEGEDEKEDEKEEEEEEQSQDQDEEQSQDNESNDEAEEEENDDYVFYDDYAIQNCEEGDEDCELAATYAAYDEDALANCEEDDEECNQAAAYMAAKAANEQQEAEEEKVNPWDINTYTDKYNSMSRRSQIWTIALAVWFLILFIITCYLCCCRKGYKAQKPLRESLMGGTSAKSSSSYNGNEELA